MRGLGGPQLGSMMSKVGDRISEQFLEMHRSLKARVPPGRVVHRQRPVARTYSLEARENRPMDTVELSHDARPAEQPSASARASGIDSVEEWRREVEDPGKDPREEQRQMTEENQDVRER
jgi:hypothetical protein